MLKFAPPQPPANAPRITIADMRTLLAAARLAAQRGDLTEGQGLQVTFAANRVEQAWDEWRLAQ